MLALGVPACNPAQGAKAGLQAQGLPGLQNEFQANPRELSKTLSQNEKLKIKFGDTLQW